ncbi:MAG: hypothetical protein AAFV33_26960, partial [Chloroflexota bacterium]
MNDLLKKLNVLVKAGVNDVLDDVQKAAATPGKFIPRSRLGKEIDHEVEYLRKQINKALDFEDQLNKKIADAEADIANLDRQADEAVGNNDDSRARYMVERLHRAQQRKTMLEADLREHRIATQELITRVNELDATISEARHREQQQEQAAPPPVQQEAPPPEKSLPQQAAETVKEAASRLSAPAPQPAEPEKPTVTSIPVTVEADDDAVAEKPAPAAPAQAEPSSSVAPPQRSKPTVEVKTRPEPSSPAAHIPMKAASKKPAVDDGTKEVAEASAAVARADAFRQQTGKLLSDALREARETVEKMDDLVEASYEVQANATATAEVEEELAKSQIDNDIASRRARLTAPP